MLTQVWSAPTENTVDPRVEFLCTKQWEVKNKLGQTPTDQSRSDTSKQTCFIPPANNKTKKSFIWCFLCVDVFVVHHAVCAGVMQSNISTNVFYSHKGKLDQTIFTVKEDNNPGVQELRNELWLTSESRTYKQNILFVFFQVCIIQLFLSI